MWKLSSGMLWVTFSFCSRRKILSFCNSATKRAKTVELEQIVWWRLWSFFVLSVHVDLWSSLHIWNSHVVKNVRSSTFSQSHIVSSFKMLHKSESRKRRAFRKFCAGQDFQSWNEISDWVIAPFFAERNARANPGDFLLTHNWKPVAIVPGGEKHVHTGRFVSPWPRHFPANSNKRERKRQCNKLKNLCCAVPQKHTSVEACSHLCGAFAKKKRACAGVNVSGQQTPKMRSVWTGLLRISNFFDENTKKKFPRIWRVIQTSEIQCEFTESRWALCVNSQNQDRRSVNKDLYHCSCTCVRYQLVCESLSSLIEYNFPSCSEGLLSPRLAVWCSGPFTLVGVDELSRN